MCRTMHTIRCCFCTRFVMLAKFSLSLFFIILFARTRNCCSQKFNSSNANLNANKSEPKTVNAVALIVFFGLCLFLQFGFVLPPTPVRYGAWTDECVPHFNCENWKKYILFLFDAQLIFGLVIGISLTMWNRKFISSATQSSDGELRHCDENGRGKK